MGLGAVARRDGIRFDVTGTGVQQAVVAAARPGGEVASLDEDRPQATHRQVAQDAGTGGTAADHDDVSLGASRHHRSPRSSGSEPRR